MKVTTVVVLAGALVSYGSVANGQSNAQAGSSADSKTSAQADKSGAQASNKSAGATSAQAGQKSASLSSGTAMNAALSQPLDAKKNKPGDPVTARTTEAVKSDGKVLIPRGTRLLGHVTETKAREKGENESKLGIAFDKAILKNGQEIPLNATIQALAAAQTAASSSVGGDDLATSGGGAARATGHATGGALGGVQSAAGGAAGAVTNTAANAGGVAGGAINSTTNIAGAANGTTGGLNAAGQLTSASKGVFGLNNLNLSSAASNSAQGSVITSTSKNVHLDSGTQMLLVTQSQASAGSTQQ
jgi:type IV secretory pathway VirB10-like protein